MKGMLLFPLALCAALQAQTHSPSDRAQRYLHDLIRIDTTNPPGNETVAAEYLKKVAAGFDVESELLGAETRKNFVARLKGSGAERPLLLMAHTDVVPADRAQWTADPFAAEIRNGQIYGRGAVDTKNLLAAELAVFTEIKRRGVKLKRDVILLAESDEEAGSTGIEWLVKNAWDKIDAEFALNEGGFAFDAPSGARVFQAQTSEKIPTRVVLLAHGTAGHGSLPRPDNPVARLARAITRLVESDQPVRLNTTTSRYLRAISKLENYRWLAPYMARLNDPVSAESAANQIRARDPEIDAMLRTTISPTMLKAGFKVNVIPNVAEAQVDIRRLPSETSEEIRARLRRIINDDSIEVRPAGGQEMPATEPSSLTTPLYLAMERVLGKSHPKAVVVPFMTRGATDGSFLRQKGMAVYGVPLFLREGESFAHANDERIGVRNLRDGTDLLMQIVLAVAAE